MAYIIVKKFEDNEVVKILKGTIHHRLFCCAENIAIASESVVEKPNVSIPRHSQELDWLIKANFAFRSAPTSI